MRKVKERLAFSWSSPGGFLWLLKWLVVTLLVLFVLLVLIAPEKAFAHQLSDDALSGIELAGRSGARLFREPVFHATNRV